jgi:hypothetical protein
MLFQAFSHMGIPVCKFLVRTMCANPLCESPYANKYCSNTPKMNFLRIWDPHKHNEIVRLWGLTCIMIDFMCFCLTSYATN